MITITALDHWLIVAWERGYLQASREVPAPPMPQPALVQIAASEGSLEATPQLAQQTELSLEALARLFAEVGMQGYGFRYAQAQARQTGRLPESAGIG